MRAVLVSLSLSSLLAATAPVAGASSNLSLFAVICASSVGFSELDRSACTSIVSEPGDEQRKTALEFEALLANLMSGGRIASLVAQSYTGVIAMPYVTLNVDPCDAFLSSGGEGCSTEPGATGYTGFGSDSLNDVLTDEQEALLGCGPFFGTDCEVDGIDLANAEASVLLQSFPSRGFVGTVLPGARGPGDPSYDPDVDGCAAPVPDPACEDADALLQPFLPQNDFESEMAALSWNFLMTLVALDAGFDPNDPTSHEPGQCSFAQPQYCSSVIALLPEPAPALGALASVAAVASLRRRRGR